MHSISDIRSYRIGIVSSRFNAPMTTALLNGTLTELISLGFVEDHIQVVEVPGAVEIPVVAQALARSKSVDALIALGVIIRGETSHYEAVCDQVSYGCQRIALDEQLPLIFEVLMAENEAQIWDRLGGLHGHKGIESARCAVEMIKTLRQLRNPS